MMMKFIAIMILSIGHTGAINANDLKGAINTNAENARENTRVRFSRMIAHAVTTTSNETTTTQVDLNVTTTYHVATTSTTTLTMTPLSPNAGTNELIMPQQYHGTRHDRE